MSVSSRRRLEEAPPIGRDVEAARLAQMIDDAAAGAKRAALLLGAPGIGKTTLLRFAQRRAEVRGCISIAVRVPATAGLPPRFPLGELLERLVLRCESIGVYAPDRLRKLVDALTGATSVETYAVSLPQIADALEEVGRLGTIAIFIDDYHWAPAEGTELLMAALRIVETSLCFLASARLRGPGEDATTPLPEPTADLWIDHLEVRGLDPAAVAEVAASELGGEILPSLGEALTTRTLGNPLFIRETLQGWRARGALMQTGGYWGVDEEAALTEARSLREMIASRFARLDDDARAAAAALAVIGREASFEEIGAIAGLDHDRLVSMMRLLAAEGLVASDVDRELRYRIAHPLYTSAFIETLGSAETAVLHGRVCHELRVRAEAGHPTLASELAHHAVRALDPPSDLTDILHSAASEAEDAGSSEEAAVWYGHLAEQADDPSALVLALTGQATAEIRSDPQRATQLFTYALELEDDDKTRARLFLGRARAHRVAGLLDLALADLEAALPLATPDDAFDIRHATGAIYGMQGRIDDAEAVFASLAETNRGTSRYAKAIGHLGMVAYARGRLPEAASLQEEALRATDDPSYGGYLGANLHWMHILLGRWDEALHLQDTLLRDAVAAGNVQDEFTVSAVASRLAAWRGDLGSAFDHARRAVRLADRLGNPADKINAYDTLATALLENDMPEEAAAILSDVMELDQPDVEPREFSFTYATLASACLAAGDLHQTRVALSRARNHLPLAPQWAAAIDRVEADLQLATGNPLASVELLRSWLVDPSPIVIEQAQALEVFARALAAVADRSGAQRHAEQALQIYERLGARKRAARVASWLQARAVRRPGRPRSSLPGNLTQRETEILHLVVLGGSNRDIAERLFISIGTVKKHLENLTAKAGVSRRQELLPFAISIGALTVEELRREPAARARRVVDLTTLERVPTD
jgi:DNA-binding CsgD family transcriptional regulator